MALLLLGAVILLSAAGATTAQDCANATFQGGRTFQTCNSLPVLGASLHWTYNAENGTADIAFRAPQSSSGWVAWGINPSGLSMGGSNVFIASQDSSSGAVSVLTTVLESTSPSLTSRNLSFEVPVTPAAEYVAGVYTIFTTVKLPSNTTAQNTVWQAGPGNTGAISPHPRTGANLQSTRRLDFLSG
ncbi:hypothetical protein GUJ93_ZPchr0006g45616 [Zizania palustris]|uniref:DOMON domain-containing protein n=1 Tax=Zizania palustris TaxID=103762 RepID=A0A8J5T462_ZIZPA|nr:hypothetical protein GUJ93_ZPchr0006g45616 [Zizania palustris]